MFKKKCDNIYLCLSLSLCLCPLPFPLSFILRFILLYISGLQSILYNESTSTRGILGLANGWQQRIDNHIWIDAVGYLYGTSSGIHINGSRSNVQSCQSENSTRFVFVIHNPYCSTSTYLYHPILVCTQSPIAMPCHATSPGWFFFRSARALPFYIVFKFGCFHRLRSILR